MVATYSPISHDDWNILYGVSDSRDTEPRNKETRERNGMKTKFKDEVVGTDDCAVRNLVGAIVWRAVLDFLRPSVVSFYSLPEESKETQEERKASAREAMRQEAIEWIWEESDNPEGPRPWGFMWCCEQLSIDHTQAHKAILELDEANISSLGCPKIVRGALVFEK